MSLTGLILERMIDVVVCLAGCQGRFQVLILVGVLRKPSKFSILLVGLDSIMLQEGVELLFERCQGILPSLMFHTYLLLMLLIQPRSRRAESREVFGELLDLSNQLLIAFLKFTSDVLESVLHLRQHLTESVSGSERISDQVATNKRDMSKSQI